MVITALLPRVIFACFAIGGASGAIASFLIVPEKRSFFKCLDARPKKDFTQLGWHLRQVSVFCAYLGCAIGCLFWLLPK